MSGFYRKEEPPQIRQKSGKDGKVKQIKAKEEDELTDVFKVS